jgi:serine phosphatase RsbU (regulator of sigma subunit)
MVVVLVVDLANTSSTFALTVLYAVAPLIACAVLPPRPTGTVAAAASALAVASGAWNDTWGTGQHAVRIADVVLVGLVAVIVASIRERREREVARLTALADVAQRAILPVLPARAGPVEVGARYLSAAQDAMVGGDLYDCYRYVSRTTGGTERVRFIVGDVRGKGISGVEQAARVIRAFRQSAAVEPTLALVAEAMDQYLADFFGPEEFATAVLVDVSDAWRIELVSCGHPPALLHRTGGQVTLVDAPPGLPLGLGLPATAYERVVVPWTRGDRLMLYTDGLSEARDRQGEFLSPLALEPALRATRVVEALDAVMATVTNHTPDARLADDLAVVLLECAEPAEVPDSAGEEAAASAGVAGSAGSGAPLSRAWD